MRRSALTIIGLVVVLYGCATVKRQPVIAAKPQVTTHPVDNADLALDDIPPKPVLGATTRAAATQPTTQRAPLDALELFAHARDAMLQGQRYTAINLLEKAIKLDPDSFELHYWLGQANAGSAMPYDPAIAAYEAAAAIAPDHLAVHSELGRLYLAKGDVPRSLEHLRLALQTIDYDADASASAVVDFYLGKALQRGGYDRAALDCYVRLIQRLQTGGLIVRGSPELAYLTAQPESLFVQVGELCQKRGMQDDAIRLYRLAVDRKGDDFGFQSHLVRALADAGRRKEATAQVAEVVRKFRANPDSLALLREVFRKAGGDDAVVRELRRLRREHGDDRTILYALVDVLSGMGRSGQATELLRDAATSSHYQSDVIRRLFKLYDTAGDIDAAARLLIDALAARPDATRDLAPMWSQLLRPWRKDHLTVARFQALDVAPQSQAAKLFWLSELARNWGRETLARNSLERAVKQAPPFAPAYRVLLGYDWLRDDWSVEQKKQASAALVESVERQGDRAFAAELRGLVAMAQKDFPVAIKELAKAQELGNNSPDVQLAHATALQASGENERAEQVLWMLTRDVPTCEDAYLQLFRRYLADQQPDEAVKVLQTWLAADPNSVNAKIFQAQVLVQANQPDSAERVLNDLLDREPDNGDVLAALSTFYAGTGKVDQFIAKLEAQRTAHPENRTALEQLVIIYAARKQTAEATHVLDDARRAVGSDPDLLYYVASLYTRIGQKETTEQVLEQVVKIDPTHAPACNDLGYTWAEQGKNLLRAESLIRTAVEKEPDNQSYLDSLGWVLYKRGRFDQARAALEDAIGSSSLPDPVSLDHLADTLYRLNRKDDAAKTWKRSQERLTNQGSASAGDEQQQLRLQLQQKIKQAEAGQPVSVSPVVEEAPRQAQKQAKKED